MLSKARRYTMETVSSAHLRPSASAASKRPREAAVVERLE